MADELVGYKKPPTHTRFQPGKSGNPSGRPKRKPTFADRLREKLDAPETVMIGGRELTITGREALASRIFEDALQGDRHARQLIVDADRQSGGEQLIDEASALDAEIMAVEEAPASQADELPALPPPKEALSGDAE